MKESPPRLLLTSSPFLKPREDTHFIMWQVNYALIPVMLASVYFFGLNAVLIAATCLAGVVCGEYLVHRGRTGAVTSLADGSAVITGGLLALTLPPQIPLWMAFLGSLAAIFLGKLLFGGLGYNPFNPALVGRAFLQAAFPQAMTTWTAPLPSPTFVSVHHSLFATPFAQTTLDAVTTATPLAKMKFEAAITGATALLAGSTAGSLGETSAAVILPAGIYLALRRIINWRIPVSIFATVLVLGSLLHALDPEIYPPAWFHLFAGGLMLGAIFMATDPVTSPITERGCVVFGIGIGTLVLIIRLFGGLPEGVMYAILFMNAATPLINRLTRARVYGT